MLNRYFGGEMSQISKAGVIGAGHMGSGIAQKIAQEGIEVVMVDITEEYVERGLSTIKGILQSGIKRRIFTQDQVDSIISRIKGSTSYDDAADADIIIEAVFEDKDVKTKLFQQLDKICQEKTIFATNTSSFYVSEFAAKISRPDRFIGLHYFFHPAKNRLLEIIPHSGTSQETIITAETFARLHGKTAITVKDSPGFAINRFFIPCSNEACRMLEEGMGNVATIDEGSKRAFGIGMGWFDLLNVTGIPLAVHASESLGHELGLFYGTPDILKTQMEKNQDWDLKDGPVEEEKIAAVIDRFYGICLGVAATVVDEGVASIEDVNIGAKLGLRWAKGPFEIMNHIGIDKTCEVVEAITKKYPGFPMPKILLEQKAKGAPFKFKVVDLEIKDHTAWLTINRPDAMNALNEEVVAQLSEKFAFAEGHQDVKAIVIQGAGKAFVAGADIQFFVENIKAGTINRIEEFTRKGHELLLKIENCAKKTIAFLDGLSLGGGSELALACQYIVATPKGSMGFPETGIGIIPGLGGMIRTQRIIGTELAKYYVFTGSPIPASVAMDLGLFNFVVEPGQVESAVQQIIKSGPSGKYETGKVPEKLSEIAAAFAPDNVPVILSGGDIPGISDALNEKIKKILGRKSAAALKMANEVMQAQIPLSISDAVEYELNQLDELFRTADALEGLSSAVEHRKPIFKGNKA
jgi:enoyl-CoA hydratase/3-hydroxyacyl-CoA dehydrogenase